MALQTTTVNGGATPTTTDTIIEQLGSGNVEGTVVGVSGGKIGFLAATPVVAPTLPADGTDLSTTEALANAIKAALIAYGLCK